jgi:hypothetical protein
VQRDLFDGFVLLVVVVLLLSLVLRFS